MKVDLKGCFEASRDILFPLLNERKKILVLAKSCQGYDEGSRKNIRDVKNAIKDEMSVTKVWWVRSQVEITNQMKKPSKEGVESCEHVSQWVSELP